MIYFIIIILNNNINDYLLVNYCLHCAMHISQCPVQSSTKPFEMGIIIPIL